MTSLTFILFWIFPVIFYVYNHFFCKQEQVRVCFFFLYLCLFFNFIVVGRPSIVTLNRTDESGRSCLVPTLEGKTFSVLPFSVMLILAVVFCNLYTLKKFPTIHRVQKFTVMASDSTLQLCVPCKKQLIHLVTHIVTQGLSLRQSPHQYAAEAPSEYILLCRLAQEKYG